MIYEKTLARSAFAHTVLVVDDDPLVLYYAAITLERAGYAALLASRAEGAIQLLRLGPPISLLFSDAQIPGIMDGIGLVLFVRDQRMRTLALLTSHRDSSTFSNFPEGVPFLRKPYDSKEMLQSVREVLASAL